MTDPLVLIFAVSCLLCLLFIMFLAGSLHHRLHQWRQHEQRALHRFSEHQQEQLGALHIETLNALKHQEQTLLERQERAHGSLRRELGEHLERQNAHLHREIQALSQHNESRLKLMGAKLEQGLQNNLNTSQQTFKDIISRLSRIDEAQKRLDQLSGDVRGLSDILNDKRSRGAFGETQLKTLIDNILPAQHVRYQAALANGRRPDCLIQLPPPTGTLAIDAKFPLESYRRIGEAGDAATKTAARKRFHQDVRKHINDIAEKYIAPPETAVGALMFIPAEAVFAEIHAHHPDLVEQSHRLSVWITSPTTLAAILTSARAVIRDEVTRREAHVLREQLYGLHRDFSAFQNRMAQLSRHIDLARRDVTDAHHNAEKIATRFRQLEDPEQLESAPRASLPDGKTAGPSGS